MQRKISSAAVIGCGYVGEALALFLEQQGTSVTRVRRRSREGQSAVVCCDVCDPKSLDALPTQVDVVFYLVSADEGSDAAYKQAYVDGTRNVIQHYLQQSVCPKRFVFVSSTGVYGQSSGEAVDEQSKTNPESFTGTRLIEGEKLVLECDLDSVIVRFGGIYGPGRDRMLRIARERSRLEPSDYAFSNRIHRDDCARVLSHLAGLSKPLEVYNAVDNEPALRADVLRWLAGQVGRTLEESAGTNTPGGKRVSNARLAASGYKFIYSTFREGYADLLKSPVD
ncbi:MAG: NAD-dependent epimerase/dehydratase family protein [Bdellovibrionales bacterium]|nr:NAD-dependent epimerase/dehydratase family protein [Bdellovibrionales bacterium]